MCHGITSFNVVIRNEEREVTTDLLLRMLNTKRYIFLHLRVTQKALQLPVWLFFFLLLLVIVSVMDWQKVFFTNVLSFITQTVCKQDRTLFIGEPASVLFIVNFLRVKSIDEFRRQRVESCSSTTVSSLLQRLSPPNFISSRSLLRTSDKIRPFYFYYHQIC